MTRIPALPLRMRSEITSDDQQIPEELDIGETQLPDRTLRSRDDSQNQAQLSVTTELGGIDPYWTNASNVQQLESFVSTVNDIWRNTKSVDVTSSTVLQHATEDSSMQLPEQRDGRASSSQQHDTDPTSDPEPQQTQELTTQAQNAVQTKPRAFRSETAEQLELRLSNEFSPVKEANWDTVVYIGPPPRQYNQSQLEYDFITKHFSRPYLMRSQTLRNSGSAEFADRLGPKSARAMRKLKNLKLHLGLPTDGQPKYWIDLRPEQNDDEAAQTLSELTCTPGILKWHILGSKKHIDPMLIGGKDQMNIPANVFSARVAAVKASDQLTTINIQDETDLEPDYSPLRHHSAIERLLQALAGNTPKLNSAPKVWAFFAVAKILDCARCPHICDEIYSWLFNGYNSEFIEVNPEVCYRIAMGIQNKTLLRVTYSILVGEKAANQVMQQIMTASASSPTIVKSRPLCHLDDDEVNRIDHAARSLSRRVWSIFAELIEYPILWMAKSAELYKLLALNAEDETKQQQVQSIWRSLRTYARTEILDALEQSLKVYVGDAKQSWISNDAKLRTFSEDAVTQYNFLPLPQRLFSQISWNFIKSYSIYRDNSSLLTTGWKQRGGLEELASMVDVIKDLPRGLQYTTRPSLDLQTTSINTQLVLGNIQYNGIITHRLGQRTYEVRWDAVYSAARRNLSVLSEVFSKAECDMLQQVISERESQHQKEVLWYDSKFAPEGIAGKSSMTNENLSMSPRSHRAGSADYYYTKANISTIDLWSQLSTALGIKIETNILRPGYLKDAYDMEADIRVDSIDTLLCLDEEEFKFLPLWADGCDDGTGGVYTEAVPGAIDEDFQGGKRGLDMDEGLAGLDDIEMGESFSVIDAQEAESTVVGASHVATAGLSQDSVMSLDE